MKGTETEVWEVRCLKNSRRMAKEKGQSNSSGSERTSCKILS